MHPSLTAIHAKMQEVLEGGSHCFANIHMSHPSEVVVEREDVSDHDRPWYRSACSSNPCQYLYDEYTDKMVGYMMIGVCVLALLVLLPWLAWHGWHGWLGIRRRFCSKEHQNTWPGLGNQMEE